MKKVWIIAAAVALAFAVILAVFASNSQERADKEKEAEKIQVVVAKEDIEEGAQITTEQFELIKMDPEDVKSSVFNFITMPKGEDSETVSDQTVLFKINPETKQLYNMVAVNKLFKGEPVAVGRVRTSVELAPNYLSYKLDKGTRAITLIVNSVGNVGSYARKGDHVDIILSNLSQSAISQFEGNSWEAAIEEEKKEMEEFYKKRKEIAEQSQGTGADNTLFDVKESISKLMYQDVEILSIGSFGENSNGVTPADYGTITIALPVENAVKLAEYMASMSGTNAVTLLLRNREDKETLPADHGEGFAVFTIQAMGQ